MTKNTWKLNEAILMAVFGVLFSAIYLIAFQGGLFLSSALAPTGLAPFAFDIVYGVWFMAATLAAFIIRKPGVALVTEVLAAAIELLMGNAGGSMVVIAGIIQGVGVELVFALLRYKRFDRIGLSLAAIGGATAIFIFELYSQQFYVLHPALLASKWILRAISAVSISGLLVYALGTSLKNAGVLKSFSSSIEMEASDNA